ncbi:MAG: alpha/beta hydrolase, partial [Candidatus Dormibacteraceae bacterium]
MVGQIEERWIESQALADNPLGDPTRRPIWVYLPPGYKDHPNLRYPSIYQLQAFTNQIDMWNNRSAFRPTFPELLDQAIAEGECAPCLVIFVDCWTSLGGSQFLDSSAVGRYHTYLCQEIVPFIDSTYRTLPGGRGLSGHSSGGYGAMVTAMLRPDLFSGLASHAGDALFELCYLPSFALTVRALRDSYDGSYQRFWEDFRSRIPMSKSTYHLLFEPYAMSACYSPGDRGEVHLPFDVATGQLIPEVWERWLSWDPVRMVANRAEALRSLKAIYFDAGRQDDYFLDLGAQAFKRELEKIGVNDVYFDLFDG